MNAQPHARAHAPAHASSVGSVSAKGREGTGPHITGPNGVLSVWSPEHHIVQLGDVVAARLGVVSAMRQESAA